MAGRILEITPQKLDGIPGELVDEVDLKEQETPALIYEVPTPYGLTLASFRPLTSKHELRDDYVFFNERSERHNPAYSDKWPIDRILGFACEVVELDGEPGVISISPRADFTTSLIEAHFTEANGLGGGIREFVETADRTDDGRQIDAETWSIAQALGKILIGSPDYVLRREGLELTGIHGHDVLDHGPGFVLFTDFIIEETERSLDQLDPKALIMIKPRWTIADQIGEDRDVLSDLLRISRWTGNVPGASEHTLFRITNLRRFIREDIAAWKLEHRSRDETQYRVEQERLDRIAAGIQTRSDAIVQLAESGQVEDPFPRLNAA